LSSVICRWSIDRTPVRNAGGFGSLFPVGGKGWKGRLIGVALVLAGTRMLRSLMERALARARD
jgi:hypothetical protein